MESFYRFLESIGYPHPIHPTQINMPIGLMVGTLILAIAALVMKKKETAAGAKYTAILAAVFVFPTAIAGLMDWWHYYKGVWFYPIQIKLTLGIALLVLLLFAVVLGWKRNSISGGLFAIYILAFANVVALGYFGGEIVFGARAPNAPPVHRFGEILFRGNCSGCHPYGGNKLAPNRPVIGAHMLEASDSFVNWIRNPAAPMPAFGQEEIPNEKAEQLYRYIVQIWEKPAEPQHSHAEEGAVEHSPRPSQHQTGDDHLQAQAPDGQTIGATVGMTNQLTYTPERVSIRAGQTVKWTNTSDIVHTVTADPQKANNPEHVRLPGQARTFDSGDIEPGGTFTHTFTVPGTYRYFCIPHEAAGMVGEVEVMQ